MTRRGLLLLSVLLPGTLSIVAPPSATTLLARRTTDDARKAKRDEAIRERAKKQQAKERLKRASEKRKAGKVSSLLWWELQATYFAESVVDSFSRAWKALHHAAVYVGGYALELPSWVKSELKARLMPSRLPNRFPGQELFVRPLRRAFAWRRANRLVRSGTVADLSGTWRLEERIRMDEFLRETGFSSLQRAVVQKAGQVQVIASKGKELTVLTRDMRGTSELVLPLNNRRGVAANDGDDGMRVCRSAFIEGQALVMTEKSAKSGEMISVTRRSLQKDGRMCVDIRKRRSGGDGFVSMRVVFTLIDD